MVYVLQISYYMDLQGMEIEVEVRAYEIQKELGDGLFVILSWEIVEMCWNFNDYEKVSLQRMSR